MNSLVSIWVVSTFPGGFPGGSEVKNPPANAGDVGLIPGLRISPGEGKGNPIFLPGKSHRQRSLGGYSLGVAKQ